MCDSNAELRRPFRRSLVQIKFAFQSAVNTTCQKFRMLIIANDGVETEWSFHCSAVNKWMVSLTHSSCFSFIKFMNFGCASSCYQHIQRTSQHATLSFSFLVTTFYTIWLKISLFFCFVFLSQNSFKLWIWFRLSLCSLYCIIQILFNSFNSITSFLTEWVGPIRLSVHEILRYQTRAHAKGHFGRCFLFDA